MSTVWSAPKQEYDYAIGNMVPCWVGETASAEEIDEALSQLANMLWDFQRRLAGKWSNPDNNAAFQAKLYKNIDPDTAKAIIEGTHHPNRAMHKIITSANCLLINF